MAFLTSHALLWLLPAEGLARGSDVVLLRRLRLAQQLKAALLPGLPALLGVPSAQASTLRPGLCAPQLLVMAHASRPALRIPQAGAGPEACAAADAATAELGQQQQQAWAAQANLRLRTLLKRCRVLQPEDSPRALCTLPSAGPVVLLLPERLGSDSQAELVAAALAELTLPAAAQAAPASSRTAAPSSAAAVAAALAPQRAAVTAGMAGSSPADLAQTWRQAVATLAAVLEAAALKARSSSSEAVPAGQSQADVAIPPEAAAATAWQEACSDGLGQFSLASCKRAAAVAADAYRRNTPALLPAAGHAAALQVRAGTRCSCAGPSPLPMQRCALTAAPRLPR